MDFEAGQFVLCVDDAVHREWDAPGISYRGGMDGLTRGSVYTVRAVSIDPAAYIDVLLLAEIHRPKWHGVEIGFSVDRFRPLPDERLSVFRQMLTVTDLDKLEIIAFDLKQDVRDIDKAWTR